MLVKAITTNSPHTNRVNKRILTETDGMQLEEGLEYELGNSTGMCADGPERLAEFKK